MTVLSSDASCCVDVIVLQRPDEVESTPGESGTKGRENQLVAFLEAVLVLVETQGDAGSTGVAAMLDVDHHLALVDAQACAHSFDDAQVGLMGDKPIDVLVGESVAFHHVLARGEHVDYSVAVNGAAFLINAVEVGVDGLVAGGECRAAGFINQMLES